MRVRVVVPPPVHAKHGLIKGRVFPVIARHRRGRYPQGYWVAGDDGHQVLLLDNEVEREADSE